MGIFDKLKQGLAKTRQSAGSGVESLLSVFVRVDEDFLETLEETLILADLGVSTASQAVELLRQKAKRTGIKTQADLRSALRDILVELMGGGGPLILPDQPCVLLIVGVNGVGKTTTIGKLAYGYRNQGRNVLLCAADTFRAAAADQLEIWAKRAGVPMVRQGEGADPAAVVFDALAAAKARGADLVLCDTAGRLHNKQNLMNELAKIGRVIDREMPGATRETLLVLDATTGQNGLLQAKAFAEATGLTGLVLTKLDGTAKGGIVVAVAREVGVPVRFIGVGEGIDDMIPFDPAAFAEGMVGL
jgi:fused signal recognition particle receptor